MGPVDADPARGQLREQLENALAEIDSLNAELKLAKARIRELEIGLVEKATNVTVTLKDHRVDL